MKCQTIYEDISNKTMKEQRNFHFKNQAGNKIRVKSEENSSHKYLLPGYQKSALHRPGTPGYIRQKEMIRIFIVETIHNLATLSDTY